VLTLPGEWKLFWEDLLLKHKCEIPHSIVDGGKERYFSIKNALDLCTGEFIAVHDGVRPFVSLKTIERCFLAVQELGQVVPVLPVKESLRFIQENESKSLDRTAYFTVQTPQCFKKSALVEAYKIPFHSGITDDASLVEEAGFFIHSVEGNEENIKVTTPLDIILADFLLKR
jgi:2-C-methyl-D-erythritol 4-phosphate cytidylyltransferase